MNLEEKIQTQIKASQSQAIKMKKDSQTLGLIVNQYTDLLDQPDALLTRVIHPSKEQVSPIGSYSSMDPLNINDLLNNEISFQYHQRFKQPLFSITLHNDYGYLFSHINQAYLNTKLNLHQSDFSSCNSSYDLLPCLFNLNIHQITCTLLISVVDVPSYIQQSQEPNATKLKESLDTLIQLAENNASFHSIWNEIKVYNQILISAKFKKTVPKLVKVMKTDQLGFPLANNFFWTRLSLKKEYYKDTQSFLKRLRAESDTLVSKYDRPDYQGFKNLYQGLNDIQQAAYSQLDYLFNHILQQQADIQIKRIITLDHPIQNQIRLNLTEASL